MGKKCFSEEEWILNGKERMGEEKKTVGRKRGQTQDGRAKKYLKAGNGSRKREKKLYNSQEREGMN